MSRPTVCKLALLIAVLVLLTGCLHLTGDVDDATTPEPSPTERAEETLSPGDDRTPAERTPAAARLTPAQKPAPETPRRVTPTTADPSTIAATPEPIPEVRPIYSDARHPGDPGETTLTFESGKTIHASDIASRLAQNVNETRRSQGYPPLAWHEPMASTGRAHAADMFNRGYFEHENPEGERAWDRYEKTGYEECGAYGENNYRMSIGYDYTGYEQMSSSEIEQYLAGRINTGFRLSDEGHREIMLSPQYTHLGFGVHLGTDPDEPETGRPYEIHVVEQFCAPESMRPVVDEREHIYDEPEPNPETTPTPVPVPWRSTTETPSSSTATVTPTPIATPASTATPTVTPRPTATPTPAPTPTPGETREADLDWTSHVDGDADARSDGSGLSYRVYRCSTAFSEATLGDTESITMSFDYETRADNWWEVPFVEVYVDGQRVFRGASDDDTMFTMTRGGTATGHVDRTVATGGETTVRIGLTPSDPCSASDHGNTYLDLTSVQLTAK